MNNKVLGTVMIGFAAAIIALVWQLLYTQANYTPKNIVDIISESNESLRRESKEQKRLIKKLREDNRILSQNLAECSAAYHQCRSPKEPF